MSSSSNIQGFSVIFILSDDFWYYANFSRIYILIFFLEPTYLNLTKLGWDGSSIKQLFPTDPTSNNNRWPLLLKINHFAV
jgi:hypothetical protein